MSVKSRDEHAADFPEPDRSDNETLPQHTLPPPYSGLSCGDEQASRPSLERRIDLLQRQVVAWKQLAHDALKENERLLREKAESIEQSLSQASRAKEAGKWLTDKCQQLTNAQHEHDESETRRLALLELSNPTERQCTSPFEEVDVSSAGSCDRTTHPQMCAENSIKLLHDWLEVQCSKPSGYFNSLSTLTGAVGGWVSAAVSVYTQNDHSNDGGSKIKWQQLCPLPSQSSGQCRAVVWRGQLLIAFSCGQKDGVRLCCLQASGKNMPDQWQLLPVLPPLGAQKPTSLLVSGSEVLLLTTMQDNECDALWCLDEDSSPPRWRLLTSLSLPGGKRHFYNASVGIFGNKLVVAGGYKKHGLTKMSDFAAWFDMVQHQWIELPTLLAPRAGGSLLCVGGNALLLGGLTEDTTLQLSVDCYDFRSKNNRWFHHLSSCCPRACSAFAVCGEFVLSCGGQVSSSPCHDVYAWSPRSNKWSQLPSLSVARMYSDAVIYNNSLLCVGGDIEGELCSWTGKVEQLTIAVDL